MEIFSIRWQVRHSKVRSSKPRSPGEIRANPILCLQVRHTGRSTLDDIRIRPTPLKPYVFQQTPVCPVPDSRSKFGASAEGLRNGRTIWRGLQALEQPAHLGPESPTPCRGRVSEGGAPPCHAAPWAELSASLRWRPATIRSGVSGLSRSSSPQVIQCGLLPRCGKVLPARLVVNQVDDDVPHDRTPLLIRGCDTSHSFPGVFARP